MKMLITGGSGKLGRLMVQAALAKGDQVISTYCHEPLSLAEPVGDQLQQIPLNLLDEFSIDTAVAAVKDISDKLDVIVHNARSLDTLHCDKDGWSKSENIADEIRIAVTAPYDFTKKLLGEGVKLDHILFINSIYGQVVANRGLYDSVADMPPIQYGIAKGAQLKMAKELAIRLADRDIRVNSLVLGGVDGRVSGSFKQKYNALCPQQKMLNDSDVRASFLNAIDPALTSVTGNEFVCDGGWTLW